MRMIKGYAPGAKGAVLGLSSRFTGVCMRLKAGVLAVVLGCCPLMGVAQMGGGEKVAVGSAVEPAKAQDALLSMFEQELMGVVKAMPADKFTFAPGPSNFASS